MNFKSSTVSYKVHKKVYFDEEDQSHFIRNDLKYMHPYNHNIQRSAANKIEQGFGRNEGSLSEAEPTPDQTVKTPQKAKSEPKQPKIRRPGTGSSARSTTTSMKEGTLRA